MFLVLRIVCEGIINMMEVILKIFVYKFMGGERIVGKGLKENRKKIKILEKRVYK